MSPIIEVVAPRLLAPALMLAFALIVKGYTDVGEGFSAAVIVALAVALRYATLGRRRADRTLAVARHANVVAAVGLLVALAVGFGGVLVGAPPFTHVPAPGEAVVRIGRLELTTAVAFDLGLFLLVLGSLVVLVRHLADLVPDADADGDADAGGDDA